jgi:DNA polymerase elongation subunit (family B)
VNKAKCNEIIKYLKTKVDPNGVLELTIDIETSHNNIKTYSLGKQWVRHDQIMRERNIIMIQLAHVEAKKHSEVFTLEWDWEKWDNRDEELLKEFNYILEAFDDVVIHSKNGFRFDVPYINGRLFILQLPALRMFEHKDIEFLIRRNMKLNAFGLDYLAKLLGSTGKVKMDRDDWIQIEERGSKEHMDKMRRYGKKDIIDTNLVIKKAAKYIPEVRAYCLVVAANGKCHHCAKYKMQGKMQKRGFKRNPSGKRQIWVCTNTRHPKHLPKWFTESRVQRYT